MKKKVILIFICILLLQPFVFSKENEEGAALFGVSKEGVLETLSQEIEITLMKNGISYKQIQRISFPYQEGFILFILPEGRDYNTLELYDLKTIHKERLIEYKDITKTNCSNCYSIKNDSNNTWQILISPNYNQPEVEVEVDALLYPEKIPSCYKNFDYYLNFPEIAVMDRRYAAKDFHIKFSLSVEDSMIINMNQSNVSCGLGLKKYPVYNGFICEGVPSFEETLIFGDVSIKAWDKEKMLKEEQRKKESSDWWWKVGFGTLVAFIIAIFRTPISSIGENIIKRIKEKYQRLRFKEKFNKLKNFFKMKLDRLLNHSPSQPSY